MRSSGWLGEGSSIPELDDQEAEPDSSLPSTEDVIRKTEQITKNIQELLRAAQENKHDRYGVPARSSSSSLSCRKLEPVPLCYPLVTFSHDIVLMAPASPPPLPCPAPPASRASVKACVGSGTAWDASAPWSPGLRKPPLPSTRSASEPPILPPGTLASVPASQAQFPLPLPHTLSDSPVCVCVSCPS